MARNEEESIQLRHAEFLGFYTRANFNISKAVSRMGIARRTIYNWAERYPEFREAMWEAKEADKDFHEEQMRLLARGVPKFRKDNNGNDIFDGWKERPDTAILIFWAKTQMKDRGYIEGPMQVQQDETQMDLSKLSDEDMYKLQELMDKATIDDAEIIDETD